MFSTVHHSCVVGNEREIVDQSNGSHLSKPFCTSMVEIQHPQVLQQIGNFLEQIT